MSPDSRRRAWEKKQQQLEAERLKRKDSPPRGPVLCCLVINGYQPHYSWGLGQKRSCIGRSRNFSAKSKQGLPDRWRRSDVLLRVKNFIEKIRNGAS